MTLSGLAQVMILVPAYLAAGALLASVLFLSLSMADLLPSGARPTLQGLAAAMIWDRLARRFSETVRSVRGELKVARNAILIAALGIGSSIPVTIEMLTGP